jgi:hypothetical protein
VEDINLQLTKRLFERVIPWLCIFITVKSLGFIGSLNLKLPAAAEVHRVYTLFKSVDLSTDPGLISHWITLPCSKTTDVSTRTFI